MGISTCRHRFRKDNSKCSREWTYAPRNQCRKKTYTHTNVEERFLEAPSVDCSFSSVHLFFILFFIFLCFFGISISRSINWFRETIEVGLRNSCLYVEATFFMSIFWKTPYKFVYYEHNLKELWVENGHETHLASPFRTHWGGTATPPGLPTPVPFLTKWN